MSHEIRTPLNAIVGFAQILDVETEIGDERKEYTHIIMDNSALLLNLVNDILDISRLESERYRFTFAEENLMECCRSALMSVEHRVKPGVELKLTPEDENFILKTDKLRLQQVLINLVGNATNSRSVVSSNWLTRSTRQKESYVSPSPTPVAEYRPTSKTPYSNVSRSWTNVSREPA